MTKKPWLSAAGLGFLYEILVAASI